MCRRPCAELDYTINDLARSLQTRKTQTIGMLIPDITNPFYARVVRGVEGVLKEAGYSLILGDTNNRHEEQLRYLSVFRSKQVDGFLLFITPGDDNEAALIGQGEETRCIRGTQSRGYEGGYRFG